MTKTKRKRIAFLFLLLFSVQTFFPVVAYALTSGPATPEMTAFEPASTANMVDLFSGDFSYNIPLLDVGGYPLNLSYRSGGSPEDEASWVGFGWTLNPGAINRQLRGLPDDFNGDEIKQEDYKKPNVTVGGNINASMKLFGNRLPKLKIGRKKKNINGNMKVKIGILHNNYTGYKGVIGIGTGFGTSDDNSDAYTKGLGPAASTDLSTSLGLNVENQSGINPYAAFDVNYKMKSHKERVADRDLFLAQQEHSAKTFVNTWCGSKIFDLNASRAKVADMHAIVSRVSNTGPGFGASSAISFSGFQPPSMVQTPMVSKNFTASLSLGITLFGGTVSPGIEGTFSKQELKDKFNSAPAYGFMHSHLAKSKRDAILDYNMEKESPYFKRLPNLGVTVFTPDLYNVTSNAGSMQFRPYLRGSGIFFQPHKHDVDRSTDIGLEPAGGNLFHLGVPLQLNKTNNISGKWNGKNDYLSIGDFKSTDPTRPDKQGAYFRRVGEKNRQDDPYFSAIGNANPVAVRLDKDFGAWAFGNGKAKDRMRNKNGNDLGGSQVKTEREKANHSINFLTASEATKFGLEKEILNYRENTLAISANPIKKRIGRTEAYRQSHHISQYTITQDDGQRMVYGIPVYNKTQQEVSFAIPHNSSQLQTGIALYSPGWSNTINNNYGKDNYYHKTTTPAYTTGHLLTSILSPDYVDVKGDGITDDDMGTSVKFNYSLVSDATGDPLHYNWRTPYSNMNNNNNTANYNEGYKSITDDDKGNYTWGQKELWYLHSVESKTMVAQFYTDSRNDGLGVVNENGGKNTAQNIRLKKLKEIRLYSKADLYANGINAIPIKVVHFEYYGDKAGDPVDPIMNGMPNHASGKGKLTLKRIWFSYGNNTKGQHHGYTFKYNIPANQFYEDNQSDRWGNYKPKSANINALTNLEFPYATQNKQDADNFASYWQLNEIELPSGGIIQVQYESDDYAYVQDRRATQMCFVAGIGSMGNNVNFSRNDKVFVKLPAATTNEEVAKRYFEGLKSLAYKALTDLDGRGHWEYVSGYADIGSYRLVDGSGNPIAAGQTSDLVEVTIGKINGKYNPIAKAAWQKLRLDLPRYAYPEFDNLDAEGSGFIKAIKALGAAFGRFKDLVESFDSRAERKKFGNTINLAKSWVRLCTPIGAVDIRGKLGGGHRVKEIRITDQWAQMSGVASAEVGSYGQRYEYTTEVSGPGGQTETVSSGVASYEPMMGGDENPFREPINYVDKHLFGMPKYFYLERPMGESYFPGASVGYSKVKVKNLGADGSVGENGTTVNEFYTAKDFPTRVDELPMERLQPKLNFLPRLFGAKLTSAVTVSQGYVVENNDMHGRPKAEAVYGKNGDEISSGSYHYKTINPGAERLALDNTVDVVSSDGQIESATVGMDIDLFTEMNESSMENIGIAVDPSFGVALYGIIPKFSIKLPLPKPNYEKRLYRGSSTVKLVNRYAILEKTVKRINGSTSTTQNMLWDAETGEVLLSKTNNEFAESIYTFNYPAHWAYDGMGSAFKNEGVYLTNFSTGGNGLINTYTGLLTAGDELVDLNGNNQYWVVNVSQNNTPLFALIRKDGTSAGNISTHMKILRSGRRNLAAASIGTIVSMVNPIVGSGSNRSIDINVSKKILQAKAVEYNQDWPMPVDFLSTSGPYHIEDCTSARLSGDAKESPEELVMTVQKTQRGYEMVQESRATTSASRITGTSCTCDCLKGLFDYLIATQRLFILQSENLTVGQVAAQARAAGYPVASCPLLDRNSSKPFYALTFATTGAIYSAQIGDCKVSIRSGNGQPVSFYSLVSQTCTGSPTVNYTSGGQTITQTFYTTCSQTKSGSTITNNSQKITAGNSWQNGTQQFFVASNFKIPGLSSIPSNAIIISAQFYAFAVPQGFMPPAYPNAHSNTNINGSHPVRFWRISPGLSWNCVSSVNSWNSPTGGMIISNPFEDLVVDWKNIVQSVVFNQVNQGFGLLPGDGGPTVNQTAYATFASENYPDPAKRPRLEVTYRLPSATTPVATLSVDTCVGNSCVSPPVNPYITGILGNWRAKKELVFDANRVRNKLKANDPSGTDLRNSGYLQTFAPYWQKNSTNWIAIANASWQWTNEARKFNRKGQEIENMDALKRHSAAQFGYLESVPIAVAGNARYREIGFDGFEDYNFSLGQPASGSGECAIQEHFGFRNTLGTAASLDNTKSHSGNFSLKLTGNAVIEKPLLQEEPSSIYAINYGNNQFSITNGYLRYGFQPFPGKKYILSGWVHDGQSQSASINGLSLKIGSTTYNVNDNASSPAVYSKVHVVEGWKRFEVVFSMPAGGNFRLELGGNNIYLDDLRIHPYDGQLKSYVYDATSMRLMADLDENNFATFYEYDDEGSLVRVKKETEKGISTIKETRSSLRKKQL